MSTNGPQIDKLQNELASSAVRLRDLVERAKSGARVYAATDGISGRLHGPVAFPANPKALSL
jgi:hypothetical protein